MKLRKMTKKREGNPQTEDGFIRVSNELWDAWMCSRFNAREERMIKVIIRFSYGMNRTFAYLSKSDLACFMNDHLPNVDKVMKSLQARGVVKVDATAPREPLRLSLNKRYREWRVDQTLKKDRDFFNKVVKRMFGDVNIPGRKGYQFDNSTYQSDHSGYQVDNQEIINSITNKLSDQSQTGYQNNNLMPDQASDIVDEKPAGIHKKTIKKTLADINSSTLSLGTTSPSPVPDDHPFFSPLAEDHVFWSALAAAYPGQDIAAEIRKMTAWLVANPQRKHKDYKRFIQAWLAREERKEHPHGKESTERHRSDRVNPEEEPPPFSDFPPERVIR